MAQAVFDDHPLEQYLNAVETPITMPGGEPVHDDDLFSGVEERERDQYWILPQYLRHIIQLIHSATHPSAPDPFVEQFKYNVISSSLLSSELSTPVRISSPAPTPTTYSPSLPPRPGPSTTSALPELEWPTPLAVALVFLATGHYLWCIAILLATAAYMQVLHSVDPPPKADMTLSMDTLTDLVSAGNAWDNIVHDAVAVLEGEERSVFYGPTTPASPTSSLRVALHSTLQTTQSQCDNVRQLFSALTSPNELSQMSEMYAPPSPLKPLFSLEDTTHRPSSLPSRRKSMVFKTPDNKRSTWNGGAAYSYNDLVAGERSPSSSRRQKRRSAMTPNSVPPSPNPLGHVAEEEDFTLAHGESSPNFGMAVLDLHRSRSMGTPRARLTKMQSSRHPLSMTALHHALQGAIASKRYACSHLLALRFNEEEEESYWEDVRSVMALLTTTFVDASSRLSEALYDAEKARIRDQQPTPEAKPVVETTTPFMDLPPMKAISFAPMPSHLTRLAGHLEVISSSINDARENLEQCVAALKGPTSTTTEDTRIVTPPSPPLTPPADAPAFQAYDRLRRELGIALRECERGRERLLDVLTPARRLPPQEVDDDPVTPELRPTTSSDEDNTSSPSSPPPLPTTFSSLSTTLDEPHDVEEPFLLPSGIEQVFEAETGSSALFTRERSSLTREERIKLAKEQRRTSSGLGLGIRFDAEHAGGGGREKWGPGGEVVQELKDVIWKVGERRRKMAELQLAMESS